MRPLAFVPVFPGTNCHRETAEAFELVGAKAEVVFLQDFLDGNRKLYDCDLIAWSGGFSYGDHLRSGWIAATILVKQLKYQLDQVLLRKIPMIGICNGFQILVSAGLLPAVTPGKPKAILDQNQSARFEHRLNTDVVLHEVKDCVWLKGLDGLILRLPVAHAEGQFVKLANKSIVQVAATYGSYEGDDSYPVSPSGSKIAGVACQQTFGLMPHPERRRDKLHGGTDGLAIFRAAVKSVQ